MKEITQFDNYTLEIWRRPRQRNMHLTVQPDGRLRVTCHKRMPKSEIMAFVEKSRGFIAKRALEIEANRLRNPPKQWLSGEKFFYLGTLRPLVITWTFEARVRVERVGAAIELKAPLTSTLQQRRAAVEKFYRKDAREYLDRRVEELAKQTGLKPTKISIRGQNTRWGSCSSTGEISLNWKLMAAPLAVIDYVIIHELAHLEQMNHSPKFWSLVAHFCPDYKSLQAWLRTNELSIRADWTISPPASSRANAI